MSRGRTISKVRNRQILIFLNLTIFLRLNIKKRENNNKIFQSKIYKKSSKKKYNNKIKIKTKNNNNKQSIII